MRHVYFVRHGESEGNAGNTYQSPDSPLSERGRRQASFIAGRCARLPIQKILASTLPRAEETARIISEKIGLPVEHSEALIEVRRASLQFGMERNNPEAIALDKEYFQKFGTSWHHSDEENFHDLLARARQALDLILKQPEDHILVVTHGFFLRFMLALALNGDSLTPAQSVAFLRGFITTNTGLSILQYDGASTGYEEVGIGVSAPWRVLTWNDHAHLAD